MPRHPYLPSSEQHATVPTVIQEYITETEKLLLQNQNNSHIIYTKDNLTRSQRTTLNKLQKRTDIVIKKSDKGDKITVETKEHCIQDGLKQWSQNLP